MKKMSFDAVIFDLDGVVTTTAKVHAKAWKKAFDDYLRLREKRDGEKFSEFTVENDYLPYVDGKPRYEGVKSFLESRGVNIPYGDPSDPPGKETVCGVGNQKNSAFQEIIENDGAEVFESTIKLIKTLKEAGIRIGVASSSKNCQFILKSAKMEDLFETRVDGVVSAQIGLKGKPEGDIFIKAAANLGVTPERAVVVEDASSGVLAGRNGGFGFVLGVARANNESELFDNGADVVVKDLVQIDTAAIEKWFQRKPRSFAASGDKEVLAVYGEGITNPRYSINAKEALKGKKKIVFFLDYDGTLTPIVSRPDLAILSEEMRDVVKKLSKKTMVAMVSGRMREDVEKLVAIPGLFYAGSHGFDISGPGFSMLQPKAKETLPVVAEVTEQLKKDIGAIKGALVEEKKFSVAAHYRLADKKDHSKIKEAVDRAIAGKESLRMMAGKMVYEILPNIEWNKGMAIRWVMKALDISWEESSIIYIGDDVTDENAFRVIRTRGTGILVSEESRPSTADFQVAVPEDVKKIFETVLQCPGS